MGVKHIIPYAQLIAKVYVFLNLVQALADPYFRGLPKLEREPSAQPISKLDFEFEERKLTKDDVREMIYREVCNHYILCGPYITQSRQDSDFLKANRYWSTIHRCFRSTLKVENTFTSYIQGADLY